MSFVSCVRNVTLGIFFIVLYISDFGHTRTLAVENSSSSGRVSIPKIVGGTDVKRNKWPWQTLLLIKKKGQASGSLTLCGGTLIGLKWVLTAAHCVENYEKMRIYFGVWNVTNRVEVGRKVRRAKNVTRHPCYDGSQETALSSYNVAIIELEREIYTETAICLERPSWSKDWEQIKAGRSLQGCVATGYGVTDTGDDAEILQKVEFSTVSTRKCAGYKISQTRKVVCASDDKVTGKDTCKGDMGGPLACRTSRQGCNGFYLAGVTLAGSSTCGEEGMPGIYAAVHPNLVWIDSVMGEKDARLNTMKKKAYSCVNHTTKTTLVENKIILRDMFISDF